MRTLSRADARRVLDLAVRSAVALMLASVISAEPRALETTPDAARAGSFETLSEQLSGVEIMASAWLANSVRDPEVREGARRLRPVITRASETGEIEYEAPAGEGSEQAWDVPFVAMHEALPPGTVVRVLECIVAADEVTVRVARVTDGSLAEIQVLRRRDLTDAGALTALRRTLVLPESILRLGSLDAARLPVAASGESASHAATRPHELSPVMTLLPAGVLHDDPAAIAQRVRENRDECERLEKRLVEATTRLQGDRHGVLPEARRLLELVAERRVLYERLAAGIAMPSTLAAALDDAEATALHLERSARATRQHPPAR